MTVIDLSSAATQSGSPRINGRSFSTVKIPAKSHTFNVANPGPSPSIRLWRRFRGAAGSSLNLEPAVGL